MFKVEEILDRTSLVDLAQKAGASLTHRGNEWRGACPIHGGDNESGFVISEKDGRELWYCFTKECGGGDAIDFVKVWRGWDFKQACEFLGGDVQSDPAEMKRLADERHAKAAAELEDKQRRMQAARNELQTAQRHLLYHDTMKQWGKDEWTRRGLDEGLQSFFTLGACDDFSLGDFHTPTLTIPIFSQHRDLLNIKHRLINPQKPNDKYRPERSGLGSFPPLLAIPEMGYDGGLIVVVEGEIKAMVTWAHLNEEDFQVIGVPGKDAYKHIAEKLQGKNVIAIPDPGAELATREFARMVGGRYVTVPEKIDDYLIETNMTSDNFYSLLKQARTA